MKTTLLLRLLGAASSAVALVSSSSASSPDAPALSVAVVIRPANPDARYLASEYARGVIHLLGGLPGITVASRSAVLKAEASTVTPERIGRDLRSRHVLVGEARQSGEELALALRLVESGSGRERWQELIRGRVADGGQASSVVARGVAAALGLDGANANLREKAVTTTNAGAWRDYLHGRQALETLAEPRLLEAVRHFERAVAAAPDFAAARVALATAHLALGYNFQNPRSHFEKARQHLTRAGEATRDLAEAAIAGAVLAYFHEWDWQAAARGAAYTSQADAAAVETHACFLHCAQTAGRREEGRTVLALAQRANPASAALRAELPCAAYYAGDFTAAEALSRAAIQDDAENPLLHWSLGRALAQQQRFDEALAALKVAQGKPGGDWTGILSEIAYIHGRQNRRAEGKAVLAELRRRAQTEYVDQYLFAMACAGLGERAEAVGHLEQAAEDRSTWIPNVALDPKFTGMRVEPGFRKLLQRLGLEPLP